MLTYTLKVFIKCFGDLILKWVYARQFYYVCIIAFTDVRHLADNFYHILPDSIHYIIFVTPKLADTFVLDPSSVSRKAFLTEVGEV